MSQNETQLSQEELASLVQPVCDAVVSISDAMMVFGNFSREPVAIDRDTQMKITADAKGCVNPDNRKQFAIRTHLTLTLVNAKKESIVDVEASYVIHYETRDDFLVSDSQADSYARYNGVFNAWSYWREYVQASCARMGIPALPVPVYRQGMNSMVDNLVTEGQSGGGDPPLITDSQSQS